MCRGGYAPEPGTSSPHGQTCLVGARYSRARRVSARLVSRGERGRVVEVLSLVVEVLALHNAWRVSLVHLIVRLVAISGAGRRDRIQ